MQYERAECRRCKRPLPRPEVAFGPMTPVRTLDELERLAIEDALKKSANVTDAARRLGIGKTTLYWKLRRYELESAQTPIVYAARVRAGLVPLTRRGAYGREDDECVWVKPRHMAEIEFRERTGTDPLRHTKFVGLRDDKDPCSIVRDA